MVHDASFDRDFSHPVKAASCGSPRVRLPSVNERCRSNRHDLNSSGRLRKAVMNNVIEVTDATFVSEVLGASKPVLIDYWADWCAP